MPLVLRPVLFFYREAILLILAVIRDECGMRVALETGQFGEIVAHFKRIEKATKEP